MTLIEELKTYAETLASSKEPNPAVSSLLMRAAEALEEAEDDTIVINDSDGNLILELDAETSSWVYEQAVSKYINEMLRSYIDQHPE